MMKLLKLTTLFSMSVLATQQISAQKINRTLKEDVIVTATPNSLELNFAKPGTYLVYQGNSPTTIQWQNPITVTDQKLSIPKNEVRTFFGIITPQKDTLLVAERKLTFKKVANFRDLGGLKTKDGRYVNWGRFYRSDALNGLQDNEFAYINQLGIAKVYDLRSDFEIGNAKDHLPKSVTYEHFPIFADKNSGMLQGLQQKMNDGILTVQDAEELLVNANQTFANEDADKFNNLLHQIFVQDQHPNLFHCTAGKDRTGYTAALILAVLGVDKQTILDEYEMTNFYTADKIEALKKGYAEKAATSQVQIEPEAIGALMSVDRKYLEAAFDIIDAKYGGIDAYIKNQLGFSDQQRQALIEKYTYKL
ncbi:tyrosine-protein phosphatase [Flavobacterium agricola]|uniref:Tyrosine-protein phosphatase n=1 Tax=Flavobacterium agricola TaxID=2870839 RepID=A0ABY6M3D4_9FLAO|nr:tyrosine-protein phosphatase [Flavobacterium agricola]UYW02397.1 tyrosine-protein phosphatase [Flavobacterium agricola]